MPNPSSPLRRATMIRRPAGAVAALLATAAVLTACGGDPAGTTTRRNGDTPSDEARAVGASFAVFPSTSRLVPRVDLAGAATSIELESARGEREGAQLVATVKSGSPRVVLVTTALEGTSEVIGTSIDATRVHAYLEQPMRVTHGSPAGRSGEYVDPLVPAAGRDVVLSTHDRMLAWVDVATPVDARPGTYHGAVELRTSTKDGRHATGPDGLLATVPVTLRVRAATIPDRPTMASSIGVDASQIVRFEQVTAGSPELRSVTHRYAKLLAENRLSIADVGALAPGAPAPDPATSADARYLDRIFSRRGVASIRIPFYLDFPFQDPLGRDRAAAVAYLRGAAAWARSKGWLDRSYVYAIDEPDESRAGEVRELHALVHEADPKLRLLVTREASARAFRGSVDIYAPNITPTRFRAADVAAQRRAGRDTWWYPSVTTWQPYPDLFVDELRPTPRALGWLAWRYDVRGLLYWSATHWHEVSDPWHDPATYKETNAVGNGDGVLVYPGGPIGQPGRPAPGVRLLQLRDGMEDHDLLAIAACVATPAQLARLRALTAALAPTLGQVTATPVGVRAMRDQAFAVIDAAAAAGRLDAAARTTTCQK